jgi:FkbM family methyltransferase
MAQNPNLAPDFVHARSVEEVPGARKLLVFPDGFRCCTHTSVEETEFIYNEVVARRDYLPEGRTLADAECVLDVGANIGVFTLFAASQNPRAVIHAFEPIRETCEVLRLNVEMNRLPGVRIYNCAVGARNEENRFFTYYPNMAGNSTAVPEIKRNQLQVLEGQLGKELTGFLFRAEARQAPVTTLSAFLERNAITAVDFLKIDVEGDELAVLQGLDRKDAFRIRNLAVETHTPQLAGEVRAELERMGLKIISDSGMPALPDVRNIFAVNGGG